MPTLPQPFGCQRDWVWRGWRIRYTYLRSQAEQATPPVLLLHGFGSSLNQWRSNLEPWQASHKVYALDLLGFGASEKAAVPYSTDLWVAQVYDFWRTWIRQPLFLIGHSLGALVALQAAIAHPEMTQGLVLMTLPAARQELLPAGGINTLAMKMEQLFASPLLLRPLFQVLKRPAVIRRVLQSIYRRADSVTDEVLEIFLVPPRDRGAARAFCYLARSRTDPHFSPATQTLLKQLQVPTLLLWGAEDRVIPITWGRQIAPLSPHLELVEIADAGHCLYDEHPEVVNLAVLEWLAARGDR